MLTHCDFHKHNEWEICLNLSGCGFDYYENETTDFVPGSIYLCPPMGSHKKVAKEGVFQDISILVTDSGILCKLKKHYFSDNTGNSIKSLMFMLYDLYHMKPPGYQTAANSLAEAICNMLVVFEGSADCSQGVEIMKNEIIKNFINPEFKVEHAAKNTNYNIDYMRRCFKKEVGINPIAYLNSLRIENAKKLLKQNRYSKYTVSEIATMSGFYDVGYFSRVFKKSTGINPREMYRMTLLDTR